MSVPTSIVDFAGGSATWAKAPRLPRTWNLTAKGAVLASLTWPKVLGTLGVADAGREVWEFRRTGVFRRRVTVRRPGSDRELAALAPRWNGTGRLEFPAGRQFEWRREGFFRPVWSFHAADGSHLVRFRRSGAFRPRAEVTIESSARRYEELPLLVTLGWHLLLLDRHDSAAA